MFQFGGLSPAGLWVRPAGGRRLFLPGSPIRRPAGQRPCAPHRGLSQLVTSFFGFLCQGIHRAPFPSCPPPRKEGAWPDFLITLVCLCMLHIPGGRTGSGAPGDQMRPLPQERGRDTNASLRYAALKVRKGKGPRGRTPRSGRGRGEASAGRRSGRAVGPL